MTTAILNLGINTKQFSSGIKSATSKLSRFSSFATTGIALAGGAIGVGLGVASFKLIKLASDAEETSNKFNSVFSNLQTSANDTAKELAKSYGLSRRESQKLLGNTGDLLTGFGFTQKSALDLSKQVQELSVDLASFQNLQGGASDASDRITKALTGEVESLKMLGVVIRQDTKEFKDNVSQIQKATGATIEQAKAQVILEEITNQSKNAIGDYSRTNKQFANQLRLTATIWDDLKVGVGLFLKDILGAESIILSFNNTFKSVTENLLGFLSNWQENFKILTDWIGRNFATLFLSDIPRIIETSIRNTVSNISSFANVFRDVFREITGSFGDQISKELVSGFLDAGILIVKESVNLGKAILDGISGVINDSFGVELKESILKSDNLEKTALTLSERIAKKASEGFKKVEFKSLLEGFDFKSEAIKFNLKINDNFKKDLEDAKKTLDDQNKNGFKKGVEQQPRQLESAVLKGSIEAFKQENQTVNKIQNKQLKELKEQTDSLKLIQTQSSQVANF